MKKVNVALLLTVFSFINPVLFCQDLSIGFNSGIVMSDIRDNFRSGKWVRNPGPDMNLSAEFSFFKVLSVKTGIDYSAVYYENRPYYQKDTYSGEYIVCPTCYYPLPPIYTPPVKKMNFSFLSVPVELQINFPSRPGFFVAAGGYLSSVQHYSLDYSYGMGIKPKGYDQGLDLSAGFKYPLGNNFLLNITGEFRTGSKKFLEGSQYRHGTYGITLGLSCRTVKDRKDPGEDADSSSASKHISLIYEGGVNLSRNRPDEYASRYLFRPGLSTGFLVNLRIGSGISFRAGALFDRMGFRMKDSSDVFFRYAGDKKKDYYVNSLVDFDYLSVPLILNFYLGKSERMILYTGFSLGIRINVRCTGTAYNLISNGEKYLITRTDIYDDLDNILKTTDFSWIVGTGYTIPLGSNLSLELAVGYNIGLREVFNREYLFDPPVNEIGGKIFRNQSLAFHIGLIVPIYK